MDVRDLHSAITPAVGLAAAAIVTNTTTNGAIVDLQNAGNAEFVVSCSARANGTYAVGLQVGNDPALSDAVAANGSTIKGTLPVIAADGVYAVGLKTTTYRYARLQVVSTGASGAGAIIGAVAILGDLRVQAKV